jgi:hypothetical protein
MLYFRDLITDSLVEESCVEGNKLADLKFVTGSFAQVLVRKIFSLRHRVHTRSGVDPYPYLIGTGIGFQGGKEAGERSCPFITISL